MKSSVLYSMISLTGMVFGAEIVASHVTQSLVLLISAYHMLYNILSLLLLVISHRMSKEKTLKNTFGWARVKVLGLLVNMLFLSALCFAAAVESVQTMVHASHEDTEPKYPIIMIILGVINFMVNMICFILIGGYTHHQGCSMIIQRDDVPMNCIVVNAADKAQVCSNNQGSNYDRNSKSCSWRGDHQILDVSRDVSSCLTVIACGCVLLLMDGLILKYADAILAIASNVVLMSTTYPFIRESGLILLQSIPNHIDVSGLTKRLLIEFPDVLNVHHLHVWRLTQSEIIATVHIQLSSPEIYPRIEKALTQFFIEEGISSVTIQPEFTNGEKSKNGTSECILQCSVNNNCKALTCCGPLTEDSKPALRHRCHSNETNISSRNSSTKLRDSYENNLNIPQILIGRENVQNNLNQCETNLESELSDVSLGFNQNAQSNFIQCEKQMESELSDIPLAFNQNTKNNLIQYEKKMESELSDSHLASNQNTQNNRIQCENEMESELSDNSLPFNLNAQNNFIQYENEMESELSDIHLPLAFNQNAQNNHIHCKTETESELSDNPLAFNQNAQNNLYQRKTQIESELSYIPIDFDFNSILNARETTM